MVQTFFARSFIRFYHKYIHYWVSISTDLYKPCIHIYRSLLYVNSYIVISYPKLFFFKSMFFSSEVYIYYNVIYNKMKTFSLGCQIHYVNIWSYVHIILIIVLKMRFLQNVHTIVKQKNGRFRYMYLIYKWEISKHL